MIISTDTSFIFARQFSRSEPLTLDWLCRQLGWPFQTPATIMDLVHLEGVFDILDLYLWLSYRFSDLFPDTDHVRDMQKELDQIIQHGVRNITRLLKTSETKTASGTPDEDDFEVKKKQMQSQRDAQYEKLDEEEVSENGSASLTKEFRQAKMNRINLRKGRLTEQLVREGLITKDVLDKLRREWRDENE